MINSSITIILVFVLASSLFMPAFAQVPLFEKGTSVDLLLSDVWIEPETPQAGDHISVHSVLYNAGIVPSSLASNVITIGYFVNGNLVRIDELPDILPGIENGIEIDSGQIWDTTNGEIVVTVIVDYSDTLSDLVDNPKNNIVQKTFKIGTETPTILSFTVSQKTQLNSKTQLVRVNGELVSPFEKAPNKKILINVGGSNKSAVYTDPNGKFEFEQGIPISNKPLAISASFYGDKYLLPSNFETDIRPINLGADESALLLQIKNPSQNYNFKHHAWDVVVYQDSYENTYKKIDVQKSDSLIDDNELLIKIPSNHNYILEVYFEGRFFYASQDYFEDGALVIKQMIIPKPATAKFTLFDSNENPINKALIKIGTTTTITNEDGHSDWIEVLPTTYKSEPYVARVELPNGNVVWSTPFFVSSDERRIIQITETP